MDMTEFRVRRARPADAAAISALNIRTNRISNAPDYPASVMQRVYAGNSVENIAQKIMDRFLLVLERDGQIIANAAQTDNRVRTFMVAPEFQGHGLGRHILRSLEDRICANGYETAAVSSSVTAIRFYQKFGYQIVADYMDGEERIIDMEKPLEARSKTVVIFDGPIGAGKSTYAQAMADWFGGWFIEGDDYTDPSGPWYASNLYTSRRIIAATQKALQNVRIVWIARPLRPRDYAFFKQHFSQLGYRVVVIGVTADRDALSVRPRAFSKDEVNRSVEMSAQGYGARSFSDAYFQTDTMELQDMVDHMAAQIGPILKG